MTQETGQGMLLRDEYILPDIGVIEVDSCESSNRQPSHLGNSISSANRPHSLKSIANTPHSATTCARTPNNVISNVSTPYNSVSCTSMLLKRPPQHIADIGENRKKPRSRPQQYICRVSDCREKFSSSEYLDSHMKLHQGVEPFTCSICKIICKTESKLNTHLTKHADDELKTKCDICERNFSSRSAVRKHKKILHKPKPHTCPRCNAGFEAHRYMMIHMNREHPENTVSDLQVSHSSNSVPVANFNIDSNSPNHRLDKKQVYYSVSEKNKDFNSPSVSLNSNNLPSQNQVDHSHYESPQEGSEQINSHCKSYLPPQELLTSSHCGPHQLPQKQVDTTQCELGKKYEKVVSINCELCTSTFPNLAYLEQHMAVHFNERPVDHTTLDLVTHHKIPTDNAQNSRIGSGDAASAISPEQLHLPKSQDTAVDLLTSYQRDSGLR